jgi:hypothetical protein
MTPEGYIKKRVKQRLAELRAYQYWPVPGVLGTTTLDCVAVIAGKPVFIETKAPGKRLTLRQLRIKHQIEAAGGTVLVIDNLEAAEKIGE